MIDQGSSELNIIIGVSNADFENAIKAIYDILLSHSYRINEKQTTFRKTIEKYGRIGLQSLSQLQPLFYVRIDGAGVCGASDGMESSGACVCDR